MFEKSSLAVGGVELLNILVSMKGSWRHYAMCAIVEYRVHCTCTDYDTKLNPVVNSVPRLLRMCSYPSVVITHWFTLPQGNSTY